MDGKINKVATENTETQKEKCLRAICGNYKKMKI
jgi:hypothetical protein